MKKSLILALALAAPVFAGDPVVTPPPTVYTPPAPCPWSVEAAVGYGFAMGDIYDDTLGSKSIDVYTADLTAVYTIDETHSVNLRFGYSFGDECYRGILGGIGREVDVATETDVHTFTLMPGYRYSNKLNDAWTVYAGANVGIANVSVKDWIGESYGEYGMSVRTHDSDWGFAWSVEVGAQYKMTDNWYAFGTWGLFGNTAEPATCEYLRAVDQQWYHGFRLGVGYTW